MDKTKMLAHVPLFAHLDKRALAQLATMVDEVDVDAGTVLMTEGRSGREFFVIVEGTVDVTRGGRHLRSLATGDFLGEIALLDDGPRTATATATSPCHLLVLTHREFDTLIADHADVRAAVMQALAERVRGLDAAAT
ncbi:MAG: family transcriptional regulator, cyclic receptor protein [Chloroflexota bacterium]|nr:family transcriptional regulator, cyclic receptor protein [Chloroflexota bacterium]